MKSLKSRSLVFCESPSFIAIAAFSLALKEINISTDPVLSQFDGKVTQRVNEIEAVITKCISQQEEDQKAAHEFENKIKKAKSLFSDFWERVEKAFLNDKRAVEPDGWWDDIQSVP